MSTPHVTQPLDGHGQRTWPRPTPADRRAARRTGYVISLLVNVFLLYAAHNVLRWEVPFFTSAWTEVLWAVDLSFTASIVANALFLAYDGAWFRHLTDLATTGIGLLAVYQLYVVYPFDAGALDSLVRVGLLGVLIAMTIAMVVMAIVALADALSSGIGDVTGQAPW